MDDLFRSLGCVSLVALAVPFWAIWKANQNRKGLDEARDNLKGLSERIDQLEKRIMELRRELRAASPEPEPTPAPVTAFHPVEPPPIRPPLEPMTPLPTPSPAAAPFVPPAPAKLLFTTTQDAPPPPRAFDWENLISVRLFAWLGGAALVLGAALFLQYGIQHGLISPTMRVAIGLVVGSLALVWGDSLRARSLWAGQATSGAGVAVLYASLFAAHTLYQLLGTTAAFAAMSLVTLVAGLLAVRRDAFILAVLGLIGGFVTPYLLATKEDHPVALLAYVLLLDVGVLAVARKRGWLPLTLLGLAGSAVLYGGWCVQHLTAEKLPYALGASLVVSALFVFGSRAAERHEEDADLARAIPMVAAMAPFLMALATSGNPALAVRPAVLVAYLLILALQAFVVARRTTGAEALVPAAAAVSVICLVFRARPDLFPSERGPTLLLYTCLSAAFFLMWLLTRGSAQTFAHRIAAVIACFGSLVVFLRVLDLEPRAEPVVVLWLYAAAHAAALLALGAVLFSGAWILAAQGYLLVTLLSLTTRFENARLSEFLPLILIPAAVFWALPFLSPRLRSDRLAWLSAGLAPVAHFAVLYWLAKPTWGTELLGAASVLSGALAYLALRRALTMHEDNPAEKRFTSAIFGAVALLFLTAAIPILLDKQWITVAWALEAAALAWLSTRIREDGLVKASAALAAVVFARLVLNPALWRYHPRSDTPIFNWYLYTFGVPVIAFLLAAHWVRSNESARQQRLPDVLRLFAGILLFVLLNVEIADFYSTGEHLDFQLSGGGLAQDMTYSLAWGLFALGLLSLGITRGSKPTRAAALVVLLLTIGKVFLHDLWDLGALYRVGSIVGLAIALLAVSFLTQRYVFAREKS